MNTTTETIRRAKRTTILKAIAAELQRLRHCNRSEADREHFAPAIDSAETRLENLEKYLPSGGGIDCGTKIDIDACSPDQIVLVCEYHHMNDGGYYDGWTTHKIRIHPTFDGFDFSISGRNRNDIKEYLEQCYHCALTEEIDVYSDDTVESVYIQNVRASMSKTPDFQI